MPFWLTTTYRRCDLAGHMTTYRWLSVDSHFDDGAGRVLQPVLPAKATKNSFMSASNQMEVWFPKTHDHKLLMHCWCSFSRWGREGIAICSAYKGSLQFLYDWLQPIGGVISQDAWPQIVDAPLTLRWRSFCYCCIHIMQSFNLADSIFHIAFDAYLVFSFTFVLITTLFFNNT
jgi:hypothetical protein